MRDLMKPAPARLLSILFIFAWAQKHSLAKPTTPFFPSNGMTSSPAIKGYTEEVLNMAGYTCRGPRFIRFDIMNRLGKMLFQVRKERADGRFVIKKEMLSLLGCSFEDLEKILVALKYRKTTQKFTDEETKVHQEYVMAYFARRDAILKAKELGELNPDDFPPITEPKPALTTDKTHPDYLSKRNRKLMIILNDRVAVPQEDEEGNPIFQTHLELWVFGKAVKPPSRYRPSKQGSNDPDKDGSDTSYDSKSTAPAHKPARQKNVSNYEKFASATKQAAKSGSSAAKRQNKRRRPSTPVQTTWAPPKQEGANPAAASPFAALAGIFEEPKADKSKVKSKSKATSKSKTKDKKT
jgi:hypothetical protein